MVLSRRESERLASWPIELLTQQEAASYAALFHPYSIRILWAAFNPEYKDDEQLKEMLNQAPFLRSMMFGLDKYDGIIPKDNVIYKKILKDGISPSSLSQLWQCPFKYLIKFIVGEDDITEYSRGEIPPNEQGTLYHKILESFYRYLSQNNLTDKLFTSGAEDILDNIAQEFLQQDNYKKYGLYPLVWKVLTKQMTEIQTALERYIIDNREKLLTTYGRNITRVEISDLEKYGLSDGIINDENVKYQLRIIKSKDFNNQSTLQGVIVYDSDKITPFRTHQILNL